MIDQFLIEDAQKIILNKKIKDIKDLQIIVSYMRGDNSDVDTIVKALDDFKIGFTLKGVTIKQLTELIIAKEDPSKNMKGSFEQINIYPQEIDFLKKVDDKTGYTLKMLYLLLILSKWSNHPSGWIRYDKKFLFNFWNLQALKESKRQQIMTDVCSNGIELRVIGSKNPIICFKVNFRFFDTKPIKTITNVKDIKNIFVELFGSKEK